MMDSKLAVIALFAILLLSGGVSAAQCTTDSQCINTYSIYNSFCDENSISWGDGQAWGTCRNGTEVETTCGQDISCFTHGDCNGIGRGLCAFAINVKNPNLCIANSALSETCRLDDDCRGSRGKSTNYCIAGVCTSRIKQCSADSQCFPTESCWAGFCRNQAPLGSRCSQDDDCDSNHCYMATRCAECNYITDAAPSGKYCNPFNNITCDISNSIYPTSNGESVQQNIPLFVNKQAIGTSCTNSNCCLTNTCTNGKCAVAGSGEPPTTPNNADFCQDYNHSLDTNWFDNALSESTVPNATFFANFFGYTPATFFDINPWNSADQSTDFRAVGFREIVSSVYYMAALFYDNSTGDICYFRQRGNQIWWHCIEDCIAAGQATSLVGYGGYDDITYTTHLGPGIYNDYQMSCKDSTSAYFYATDNDASSGSIAAFITGGMDGNSIDSFDIFTSYGQIGMRSWDGSANHNLAFYPNASFDNEFAFDKIWSMSWTNQYTRAYAGSCLTDYEIPTIGSGNYNEYIVCCNETADCEESPYYGSGYCCNTDTSTCGACSAGTTTKVSVYSSDAMLATGKVTPNRNTSFSTAVTYSLLGITFTPVTTGTVSATITGSGSLGTATCTTPEYCIWSYTAGSSGTDVIKWTYNPTGSFKASTATIKINITPYANYLTLRIVDAATQATIPAVAVTCMNKPLLSGVSDNKGEIRFNNLEDNDTLTVALIKKDYMPIAYETEASDINTIKTVYMYRLNQTSYEENLTPPFEPPQNTTAVLTGFENITYAFVASPFMWFILFIIFLMAVGAIKLLFSAVL